MSCVKRSKVDTKIFAAYKVRDAAENERKLVSKNLEKQAQAVEKLLEAEKNLDAQVASFCIFFGIG
jgi:E3 ubiquitin-protein ligase BRE1